MMPWFIWNGKNSFGDFGLWINKLPPIIRAAERVTEIQIPGRAGNVTLLEGEDVYEQALKKCVVIIRNDIPIQPILAWLRGDGKVTFCNEPDKVYFARIAAEVSFSRISNDMSQATIVFACNPLKGKLYEEQDAVTLTGNGTLRNPGDVASRPVVEITGSGNCTVEIGEQSMTFYSVSGTIRVDCDAQIITQNDVLWSGTFTGEFWKIPKGASEVTVNNNVSSMTITPRWRWV